MFIDSTVFICASIAVKGEKDGYPKRRIAVSMTGEECDKAIDDLKKSEYWSGKLQEYMETYWLPIKKVYLLVLLNYSRCA